MGANHTAQSQTFSFVFKSSRELLLHTLYIISFKYTLNPIFDWLPQYVEMPCLLDISSAYTQRTILMIFPPVEDANAATSMWNLVARILAYSVDNLGYMALLKRLLRASSVLFCSTTCTDCSLRSCIRPYYAATSISKYKNRSKAP